MSDPYYRTQAWRELRAAVLTRDRICVTAGCGRRATHADHVVPRAKGGADSLGNVRGLCQSCHNRRTASGNGALRIVGCDAAGLPIDRAHPFYGAGDTPSKDGELRGPRPLGARPSTKFPGRRRWG